MAGTDPKELKRVINKIDALRKKARAARSVGKSISALTAFDFDIIDKSLELMRETLNVQNVQDEYPNN